MPSTFISGRSAFSRSEMNAKNIVLTSKSLPDQCVMKVEYVKYIYIRVWLAGYASLFHCWERKRKNRIHYLWIVCTWQKFPCQPNKCHGECDFQIKCLNDSSCVCNDRSIHESFYISTELKSIFCCILPTLFVCKRLVHGKTLPNYLFSVFRVGVNLSGAKASICFRDVIYIKIVSNAITTFLFGWIFGEEGKKKIWDEW